MFNYLDEFKLALKSCEKEVGQVLNNLYRTKKDLQAIEELLQKESIKTAIVGWFYRKNESEEVEKYKEVQQWLINDLEAINQTNLQEHLRNIFAVVQANQVLEEYVKNRYETKIRSIITKIESSRETITHETLHLRDILNIPLGRGKRKDLDQLQSLLQTISAIVPQLESQSRHLDSQIKELYNHIDKFFSELTHVRQLNPADYALLKSLLQETKTIQETTNHLLHALQQQRHMRNDYVAKQLIAVHMTKYPPIGGKIRTTGEAGKYPVAGTHVYFPRETIHFALNGPVSNHEFGDWSDAQYSILIPLEEIMESIIHIRPADTFSFGSIKLPPSSDVIVYQKNYAGEKFGAAHIIVIDNNISIFEATKKRIRERGYTPIGITKHDWGDIDREDEKILVEAEVKFDRGEWGKKHWIFKKESSLRSFAQKVNKLWGGHQDSFFHSLELSIRRLIFNIDTNQGRLILSSAEKKDRIKKINLSLKAVKEKLPYALTKQQEAALQRMETELESIKNLIKNT